MTRSRHKPFLEHCARELSQLPEIGDGAVHRVVTATQRLYFEAPKAQKSGWHSKYARCSRGAIPLHVMWP
jgi:hypothetical protein